jgi:hypothetical protein
MSSNTSAPLTKPHGLPAKSIHLLPPPSAVKRLCFDETTRTLRPNIVLVDRRGAIVFEINELGLKGAARDPAETGRMGRLGGVRHYWSSSLIDGWAIMFLNGASRPIPGNILRPPKPSTMRMPLRSAL